MNLEFNRISLIFYIFFHFFLIGLIVNTKSGTKIYYYVFYFFAEPVLFFFDKLSLLKVGALEFPKMLSFEPCTFLFYGIFTLFIVFSLTSSSWAVL
jgi:hypothetical protein